MIAAKLCECGCGQPAPIAKRTNTKLGHVKGQPVRFIAGHNNQLMCEPIPVNNSGLCECGCGNPTPLATKTVRARGLVKGRPMHFLCGHSGSNPQPNEGPGPNPSGLCMCGCGQPAPIARCSYAARGEIKGKPLRYILGHQAKRKGAAYIVDPATGCWNWQGSKDKLGYGKTRYEGRRTQAHVMFYEQTYGPVPEGLELDHLCRNHSCVNPDHVEPVTHQENLRRGVAARKLAEVVA